MVTVWKTNYYLKHYTYKDNIFFNSFRNYQFLHNKIHLDIHISIVPHL